MTLLKSKIRKRVKQWLVVNSNVIASIFNNEKT
nr:MAG TPA: hypothetical protein [Caudoviricetes sp.]